MINKRILAGMMAAAIAITVPASAQRGPGGPGRGAHGPAGLGPMGGNPERMLGRLATVLDLTEAQKTAAQAIFDQAKAQSEPIAAALKTGHEAVEAAVKSNATDAHIDNLTAQQATNTARLASIHAKAYRAFWQLLTPEQRTKAETLHSGLRNGPRGARPNTN